MGKSASHNIKDVDRTRDSYRKPQVHQREGSS